jgi:hypothetical protein
VRSRCSAASSWLPSSASPRVRVTYTYRRVGRTVMYLCDAARSAISAVAHGPMRSDEGPRAEPWGPSVSEVLLVSGSAEASALAPPE